MHILVFSKAKRRLPGEKKTMQEIKKLFRHPLPALLPFFPLLPAFSRPATAASTHQGTPPPWVAVVRIADRTITPTTEGSGYMEALSDGGRGPTWNFRRHHFLTNNALRCGNA